MILHSNCSPSWVPQKERPLKCKPLTLANIVSGQTYIAVCVAADGFMSVDYPTFLGRPIKHSGTWWIRHEKRSRPISKLGMCCNGFGSVTDYGLDPKEKLNHHRVFRYNMRNRQILVDMVERQDLVAYLTLIGDKNPCGTIKRDKSHWQWYEMIDLAIDDCHEDWDALDSITDAYEK